jgi:hypothetical protein
VSGCVALRPTLPGVVVTCLVTDPRSLLQEFGIPWINSYLQSNHDSGIVLFSTLLGCGPFKDCTEAALRVFILVPSNA